MGFPRHRRRSNRPWSRGRCGCQGNSTLLVEQADFAKGTSSRSTKLVHGGVRYLKQGNISLVLEALRERGLLCENAPHLVHHLAFIVPIYSWWEGPFYGIGMKIYDRLAGKLGLSPSENLSRKRRSSESQRSTEWIGEWGVLATASSTIHAWRSIWRRPSSISAAPRSTMRR